METITINLGPLENFEKNIFKAREYINSQVVIDSEPFVPFSQGVLRGSVRYPYGVQGDIIEYNTPYAHYMWYGEIYGPNIPRKDGEGNIIGWWSPPGQKKHPTGRPLTYWHPGTGDHWTDRAAELHMKEWENMVKDILTER